MINLGCSRIDFLVRPGSAPTVMLRIAGYREALLNGGISPDPQWIHSGEPTDEKFVRKIIAGGATAVICANDLTAANLMKTLDAMGYPIPQKIRVAGFDDARYAELLRPPLTTIHQALHRYRYYYDAGDAGAHRESGIPSARYSRTAGPDCATILRSSRKFAVLPCRPGECGLKQEVR